MVLELHTVRKLLLSVVVKLVLDKSRVCSYELIVKTIALEDSLVDCKCLWDL